MLVRLKNALAGTSGSSTFCLAVGGHHVIHYSASPKSTSASNNPMTRTSSMTHESQLILSLCTCCSSLGLSAVCCTSAGSISAPHKGHSGCASSKRAKGPPFAGHLQEGHSAQSPRSMRLPAPQDRLAVFNKVDWRKVLLDLTLFKGLALAGSSQCAVPVRGKAKSASLSCSTESAGHLWRGRKGRCCHSGHSAGRWRVRQHHRKCRAPGSHQGPPPWHSTATLL